MFLFAEQERLEQARALEAENKKKESKKESAKKKDEEATKNTAKTKSTKSPDLTPKTSKAEKSSTNEKGEKKSESKGKQDNHDGDNLQSKSTHAKASTEKHTADVKEGGKEQLTSSVEAPDQNASHKSNENDQDSKSKRTARDKFKTCENCVQVITDRILVCAGCKKVAYCNYRCQKAHWKMHKKSCSYALKKDAKDRTG